MPGAFTLCGCLLEVADDQIAGCLSHPEVDMIEWRLDTFSISRSFDRLQELTALLGASPRHPVLATNRPERMGGRFAGNESSRLRLLERAVAAGAEWVDLESDLDQAVYDTFRRGNGRIVLSHHDFTGTPDQRALADLLERMTKVQPDVVKVATLARRPEDNLRILELIETGRKRHGLAVIAFCMGPLGRWSRPVSLVLGSPWAYVPLPGHPAAAPGQLAPAQMRTLLEEMS
jgi:3-dehydroquinate dehydratase type I